MSYKLADLFEYVSQSRIGPNAHRALVDVKAASAVLRYKHFWIDRKDHIFVWQKSNQSSKKIVLMDDSDIESDGDEDEPDAEEEDNHDNNNLDEVEGEIETQMIGWHLDKPFKGVDAMKAFEDHFLQKVTRAGSTNNTFGLQCSTNSVNSPAKAWRQIFTCCILDKIVQYTNDYGDVMAKEWSPISKQDLMDFISILFISKFVFWK